MQRINKITNSINMKRIYLIRHGKAEDGSDKPDFERDLLPKGRKKTEKIAHYLAKQKASPKLILVSMAFRTLQTAEVVRSILNLPKQIIKEEKDLYLASSNSMLDTLYRIDDQIDEIMVIGHNPGISSLATYLSNSSIDWMSTSAVVAIDLKVEHWVDLANATKKFLYYIKPSDL